jgi:hypothetical protein
LKKKDHRFASYAVDEIYNYSEVKLERDESVNILLKLFDLVETQSSGVVEILTEEAIDSEAAVTLDNLLSVLSISRLAYEELRDGGDSSAIKNVSIIQRVLSKSSANEDQLVYCTRCKVKWDSWYILNRHIINESKIQSIRARLQKVVRDVVKFNNVDFLDAMTALEALRNDLELSSSLYDLEMDELIGGFFSELVGMIS